MFKLKRNMSNFDRTIRFIVAIILLILFFIGEIRGVFGIFLIIVSTIFLFTSITAFCPLYHSTKIRTYNIDEDLE